jgi:hypothetical protein
MCVWSSFGVLKGVELQLYSRSACGALASQAKMPSQASYIPIEEQSLLSEVLVFERWFRDNLVETKIIRVMVRGKDSNTQ